jgi:hypothetical protein
MRMAHSSHIAISHNALKSCNYELEGRQFRVSGLKTGVSGLKDRVKSP